MKKFISFSNVKLITSLVVVIAVLFIAMDMMANNNQKHSEESGLPENGGIPYIAQSVDTIPKSGEVIHIQRQMNDQSVKLSMENGEITDLEINGKKIDKADYGQYGDIISEVSPRTNSQGKNRMFLFDGNDSFDFGNLQMFQDSLSNSLGDGFLKGFKSLDMSEFNEMIKNFSKHMDNWGSNFQADSFMFNLKNYDNQGFGFVFPDPDHWGGNGGIWIDGLEDDSDTTGSDRLSDQGVGKDVNLTAILERALNGDGMLIPGEMNKVEMTGKFLKINGEKQPNNLFQKYKRILEEESGIELNKDSKLQFKIEGKESKKRYRSF